MLRSRGVAFRLILLALLLGSLALAGCGGGGGGEEKAAEAGGAQAAAGAAIAPAEALAFVQITTDASSAQWAAADALLDRFPGRDKLVQSLLEEIQAEGLDWETDIKPALGPEIDIVVLPRQGEDPAVVGLTQPADTAKFEKLVMSGDQPGVLDEVDGWTVFSDDQAAIDAFKAAGGGSLADSDAYQGALESLPADSLVSVYLDGAKLVELAASGEGAAAFAQLSGVFGQPGPIVFAVSAQPGGVLLQGSASFEGGPQASNFAAELLSDVPADAVVYVGFSNLTKPLSAAVDAIGGVQPGFDQQIAQAETFLGLSIRDDLLPLFSKEGALVVAPASPIPAISLILEVDDEQQALATVGKLAALAGGFAGGGLPKTTDIDGVSAQELSFDQFSVFYAAFDGKLVITSAREGISGLGADGPKLADDPDFQAARDAAGMPDETAGFLYLDLGDGIRLIEDYARLAGEGISTEASANLEPLGALLVYSAFEDGRYRFSGFLAIE